MKARAESERPGVEYVIEAFNTSSDRVVAYDAWLHERSEWIAAKKKEEQIDKIFSELYEKYNELKREGEAEELIAANGILRDAKLTFCHPVLTHRVKLEYNVDENTLRIRDTDTPASLYSSLY